MEGSQYLSRGRPKYFRMGRTQYLNVVGSTSEWEGLFTSVQKTQHLSIVGTGRPQYLSMGKPQYFRPQYLNIVGTGRPQYLNKGRTQRLTIGKPRSVSQHWKDWVIQYERRLSARKGLAALIKEALSNSALERLTNSILERLSTAAREGLNNSILERY